MKRQKKFSNFGPSCTDADLNVANDNDVSLYWMSNDAWPMKFRRNGSIDDDARDSNDDDRKTPTNFAVDRNVLNDDYSTSNAKCRFRDFSPPSELRRTSSLVDELLNEIYARFGTDVSSKNSVSGFVLLLKCTIRCRSVNSFRPLFSRDQQNFFL